MASIYTVWTTKGKAMAAEQLGPNNPITFTRVAASSKDYSSTDPTTLAALTKLDSEQQKGYIAYSNIINSSTLHMELLFKNSEATKNYNLCAVGLYATGSDKQEYLYSITVLQNPQVINPDSAGSTFGLSLNTVVGDATTAKVTITDAGAITQAILDAELANKVNVSDMRKPASDVAGIEEVNTKQDKIGYTPADDSKVWHTTVTKLNSTDMNTILTAGFYQLINGTNVFPKGDNYTIYQVIPLSKTNGVQIAFENAVAILGMRAWNLNPGHLSFTDWITFADDSKVIHKDPNTGNTSENVNFTGKAQKDNSDLITVSDMRKPASDVAGIEEVNAKQDKIGYTPADDSKVAHLSGVNNFDTVPTVDNNPLLLASSLPSDLARTGQANTFNLTQTFSQGVKTLQTGSYDDANSLVNEGLYYNTNSSIKNGARSLTTGYIQVMSGGGEIVRQIMYSDTDGGLIYDRTSQDGGSSWSNWIQIVTWSQLPSNMVLNNRDTNFTAKLQQNGQDVALANHTLARNPDTGQATQKINFASGDLTADGYPIMAYGAATDKDDAKAKSAKYPGVLFIW